MQEAIREYVAREENWESFKQEALDSWERYQENGLHVTGEEAREWLSRWGTDGESEIPACHE